MKEYISVNFTGKTVELTEQTRFIGCTITAEQIIDHDTIGYELLGCIPPEVANDDN